MLLIYLFISFDTVGVKGKFNSIMNQICMGYVKSDLQMCDQKKAAINTQADVESTQAIVIESNENF